MPRGSKPGERRGGRKRGTPNKKTALKNAVFLAAAASPDSSPLDFMLRLMRDPNVAMDLRIDMAAAAALYVHSRPRKERVQPLDLTTRIERRMKLSDAEMETKLKPTNLLSGAHTPVGFLLRVINDTDATPQQKIKAVKVAARYKHLPGQPETFAVDDLFGFSCDLEVARDIRHCRLRLRAIGRRHGPSLLIDYTSSDIRESAIIRARLAEHKARLKRCPSYKQDDLLSDRCRLNELAKKRDRKVQTPEEESEEAYLFARIESYIETEEEAAKRIHSEMRTRRSYKDEFTAAEEAEFEDIERRYPHLNPKNKEWRYLGLPECVLDAHGQQEDLRRNLESGKSPLVAAMAALASAEDRYLANQKLLASNKNNQKDVNAAINQNEEIVVRKQKHASANKPATVMQSKKDEKVEAKYNTAERVMAEKAAVPDDDDDFQEFVD